MPAMLFDPFLAMFCLPFSSIPNVRCAMPSDISMLLPFVTCGLIPSPPIKTLEAGSEMPLFCSYVHHHH